MRVSYVKVAEYQARGALHFHAVIRLDAAQPKATRRARGAAAGRVHCRAARRRDPRRGRGTCRAPVPKPTERPRRGSSGWTWSAGASGRPRSGGARRSTCGCSSAGEAASCAGYIAKYATKSTEASAACCTGSSERDLDEPAGAAARAPAGASARGTLAAEPRAARRCGCGGGRTRSASAGTASRRAAATRRRSPRCAARATSTSCAGARRRAARSVGPPVERGRVRRAAALGVHRDRLSHARRCVAGRDRARRGRGSGGEWRVRSLRTARSGAVPEWRRFMRGRRSRWPAGAGALHHGARGRRTGRAVAGHDPALLPRREDPGPAAAGADPPGAVPVERGRGGVDGSRDQAAEDARRAWTERLGRPAWRDARSAGRSIGSRSGLWAIRYRDAHGRRPQLTGYRTKGEAREALERSCGACGSGRCTGRSVTLRELDDAYLEQYDGGAVDAGVPEGQHAAGAGDASATSRSARCGSTGSRRGGRRCRRASATARIARCGRCCRRRCAGSGSRTTRRRWSRTRSRSRARSIRSSRGTRSTRSPPSSTRSAGALVVFLAGTGVRPEEAFGARVARRRPRAARCSWCAARSPRAG